MPLRTLLPQHSATLALGFPSNRGTIGGVLVGEAEVVERRRLKRARNKMVKREGRLWRRVVEKIMVRGVG